MVFMNTRTVARMLATLIASTLIAGSANAQGISYTLAPAATSLTWDKDLGLKNHALYGGQAAIDFERLVSLQGYYFTNDKISTAVDKLGLTGSLGNQLRNQRVQVRSMGANVIWKFWSGGVAPFIKTGGGIVELRPDSGHTSKQIALNGGAGLRFGANAPLYLDLFAEDMMLRVDRYALFNKGTGVLPVDARANQLRHNLNIGAAIGVPLGLNTNNREREMASNLQWGLTGASLTVEPFAGRLKFDSRGSNSAVADQDLAGLRAGIDVGRYVGVRGFYWRSTDKDFKRFSSLQSWGSELQFRLNSSQGLTPYLLLGAAQLDFRKNDSTALSRQGTDKASLLLGGGLSLPFGERISLNFSARDYLYGQGNGADSVSSPSDLRNNWMYSVGLRVSVAGRSGSAAARRTVGREQTLAARVREDSLRLLAAREDMRRGYPSSESMRRGDSSPESIRRGRMSADSEMVVADSAGVIANMRRGSVITVPVPTVGEFYVRYGPPQNSAGVMLRTSGSPSDSAARRATVLGSVTDEDLRTLVRNLVREEIRSSQSGADSGPVANMSAADRDAYMNRRIDSIVAARVNEQTANLRRSQPVPTVVLPTAPSAVVVQEGPGGRYNWIGNDRRGGLMVYSGVTVNDGAQIALGGRFDLGPINAGSSIDFAPELSFGTGSGGRSTMIVGNLQYFFRKFHFGTNRLIQPHVVGGIGILDFGDRVGSRNGLQGVINLGYGLSIPLTQSRGNRATPVLTVEHQGIDLFQLNRLLVGLSWRL